MQRREVENANGLRLLYYDFEDGEFEAGEETGRRDDARDEAAGEGDA